MVVCQAGMFARLYMTLLHTDLRTLDVLRIPILLPTERS